MEVKKNQDEKYTDEEFDALLKLAITKMREQELQYYDSIMEDIEERYKDIKLDLEKKIWNLIKNY